MATKYIPRNTPLEGYEFRMYLLPPAQGWAMGRSVRGEYSIDGARFALLANQPRATLDGTYKVDLTAAETDGEVIVLQFTADRAIPAHHVLYALGSKAANDAMGVDLQSEMDRYRAETKELLETDDWLLGRRELVDLVGRLKRLIWKLKREAVER